MLSFLESFFKTERPEKVVSETSSPLPVSTDVLSSIQVPKDGSKLSREELVDRIKGTIYGNALGDALGLATEFMNKAQVQRLYNDKEINFENIHQDFHRNKWKKGDWTDDTDQMLLILNTILNAGGKFDMLDFAQRLKFWINNGFPEIGDRCGFGIGRTVGSVAFHDDFLKSPHACAESIWLRDGKKMAANGGVMRTSILGIPSFHNLDTVEQNSVNACKVTHADPRCIASCVAVSVAIALMLQGPQKIEVDHVLDVAFKRAIGHLDEGEDALQEFMFHAKPSSLADLRLDQPEAIGYTYKTMGSAFFAFSAEGSWKEIIDQIVREGGDADTNAAAAGALLGCKLGYSNLPLDLIKQMPHHEWLEGKIERLLKLMDLA